MGNNIYLLKNTKKMEELYGVSIYVVNQHISSLISADELDTSAIKQYLMVQKEGWR